MLRQAHASVDGDIAVPYEGSKPREVEGERALFLAVIEQAIAESRDEEDILLRAPARLWILSDDNPEWPGSFPRICEALDLDCEALRERLRKMWWGKGLLRKVRHARQGGTRTKVGGRPYAVS